MPENINRKKEEVISRETAGKIPWKYLTIILVGILLLGAVLIIANSFAMQTPAKTSTDLMNSPDKSGGDKAPPAVNGTETPSPTVNKGQEIEIFDRFGRPVNKNSVIVIGNVLAKDLLNQKRFVREGIIDFVVVFDPSMQSITTQSNIKIAENDQFVLRVKLYDKQGRPVELNNKYGNKEFVEVGITNQRLGVSYNTKSEVSVSVESFDLMVYRIDNPSKKEEIPVQKI